MTVLVTGLPGAGHLALAAVLAEQAGLPCQDTDHVTAQILGVPLDQAFIDLDEDHVRAAETQALAECVAAGGVVAVGSGAVDVAANHPILANTPSVFCDVQVAAAAKRLGMTLAVTALANPRATWVKLANIRRPQYAQWATLVLRTDDVEPATCAPQVFDQLPQLLRQG